MKAIRMHQPGGAEVLQYEDTNDPQPGAGQALVNVQAVGINFADVYARKGANPANLPPSLVKRLPELSQPLAKELPR